MTEMRAQSRPAAMGRPIADWRVLAEVTRQADIPKATPCRSFSRTFWVPRSGRSRRNAPVGFAPSFRSQQFHSQGSKSGQRLRVATCLQCGAVVAVRYLRDVLQRHVRTIECTTARSAVASTRGSYFADPRSSALAPMSHHFDVYPPVHGMSFALQSVMVGDGQGEQQINFALCGRRY